jgi:hypothetical protein
MTQLAGKLISDLVQGASRVVIAQGVRCPHCGRQVVPHDAHVDGDGNVKLICAADHADADLIFIEF